MHPVVILGHSADGAPCREVSHRDLGDRGDSLSRKIPATPKQLSVRVVEPNRDGEEQVNNVCFCVPVNTQEREICNPRDWVRLSREADQERVDPPSLPEVGLEGGLIGDSYTEPGRQSPEEIGGESDGPEDLSH